MKVRRSSIEPCNTSISVKVLERLESIQQVCSDLSGSEAQHIDEGRLNRLGFSVQRKNGRRLFVKRSNRDRPGVNTAVAVMRREGNAFFTLHTTTTITRSSIFD